MMYNPPHPGVMLLNDVLKPLDLSITAAAEHLDITRKTLSKICNGNGAITPEMAYRLSTPFKPDALFWLQLQNNYDLWHVEQHKKEIKTIPIKAA